MSGRYTKREFIIRRERMGRRREGRVKKREEK